MEAPEVRSMEAAKFRSIICQANRAKMADFYRTEILDQVKLKFQDESADCIAKAEWAANYLLLERYRSQGHFGPYLKEAQALFVQAFSSPLRDQSKLFNLVHECCKKNDEFFRILEDLDQFYIFLSHLPMEQLGAILRLSLFSLRPLSKEKLYYECVKTFVSTNCETHTRLCIQLLGYVLFHLRSSWGEADKQFLRSILERMYYSKSSDADNRSAVRRLVRSSMKHLSVEDHYFITEPVLLPSLLESDATLTGLTDALLMSDQNARISRDMSVLTTAYMFWRRPQTHFRSRDHEPAIAIAKLDSKYRDGSQAELWNQLDKQPHSQWIDAQTVKSFRSLDQDESSIYSLLDKNNE
ncbi:hypothetical protein Ciccas_001746 [Cichlidogyrus casuarinus]|uniref:Uncharacterized protein n=1 Tax=Cichlidogyrus casuarinus TaxID=1844966 RepID=A0ABD2QMB5_9PLAT